MQQNPRPLGGPLPGCHLLGSLVTTDGPRSLLFVFGNIEFDGDGSQAFTEGASSSVQQLCDFRMQSEERECRDGPDQMPK